MQIESKGARTRLYVFCFLLGLGIVRVDQISDDLRRRYHLMQQFQALCRKRNIEEHRARDVAAWLSETGDEAVPDWVVAAHENNWNGRSRRLSGQCNGRAAAGCDHGQWTLQQIG